MTTLSEIPIEETFGKTVMGASGILGKVTHISPISGVRPHHKDALTIKWNNGNISHPFHVWCSKITLV